MFGHWPGKLWLMISGMRFSYSSAALELVLICQPTQMLYSMCQSACLTSEWFLWT